MSSAERTPCFDTWARLFAARHQDKFRYVKGLGWHAWDGYRWRRGGGEAAVLAAAEKMSAGIPGASREAPSSDITQPLLTRASALPSLSLHAEALDREPYILSTPAGVVDLHTGALRPPNPARDLHSRTTAVVPRPMDTPRWHRFLGDTFGGGASGREKIDFLHVVLGYSITGDVSAQILPFLHGAGKNGKSTLTDAVLQILGDYATTAPPGLLVDRDNFPAGSPELTELRGRRMVVCSEPRPHDTFNASRVRMLTATDRIKIYRSGRESFSFVPTHHVWLLGNQVPEPAVGGISFWRRVRLLPCPYTVPTEQRVDELACEMVREEGPGILQWLIDGARRYIARRDALQGFDWIRQATESPVVPSDHIDRFLAEECTRDDFSPTPYRVEQGRLYARYRAWCRGDEPVEAASPRVFAARIRSELGLASAGEMIKSSGRAYYPGLALLERA